jgi:hypothetical protein
VKKYQRAKLTNPKTVLPAVGNLGVTGVVMPVTKKLGILCPLMAGASALVTFAFDVGLTINQFCKDQIDRKTMMKQIGLQFCKAVVDGGV